jgi:hypothetical protein
MAWNLGEDKLGADGNHPPAYHTGPASGTPSAGAPTGAERQMLTRALTCIAVLSLCAAGPVLADEAGRLATAVAAGPVALEIIASGDALVSYTTTLQAPAGESRVAFGLQRMDASLDTARLTVLAAPEGTALGDLVICPEYPGMALCTLQLPVAGTVELRLEHPLKGVEFRVEHGLTVDPGAGTMTVDSTGIMVNRSRLDMPAVHLTLPDGMVCDLGLPRDVEVRVGLQHAPALPYRLAMAYDPARFGTAVAALLRLQWPAAGDPAPRPLLAGPVHVVAGTPALAVCDDSLPFLAPGEGCDIRLGNVQEVSVTRTLYSSLQTGVRTDVRNKLVLYDMDDQIDYVVANPRNTPATVVIREKPEGDWSVTRCGADWIRLDADNLELTVPLTPGETRKVTCRIRRHFLQP